MNKDTRYSRQEDVYELYKNIRDDDVKELAAAGTDPMSALVSGFLDSSPCLTIINPKTGVPSAMMGVVKKDGPLDVIWLLGTDDIEEHWMVFGRRSHSIVEYFFKETGSQGFYNYTWIGNTLHHKWLKWLGFKSIRKVNLGPHGEEFHEFVILRGQ